MGHGEWGMGYGEWGMLTICSVHACVPSLHREGGRTTAGHAGGSDARLMRFRLAAAVVPRRLAAPGDELDTGVAGGVATEARVWPVVATRGDLIPDTPPVPPLSEAASRESLFTPDPSDQPTLSEWASWVTWSAAGGWREMRSCGALCTKKLMKSSARAVSSQEPQSPSSSSSSPIEAGPDDAPTNERRRLAVPAPASDWRVVDPRPYRRTFSCRYTCMPTFRPVSTRNAKGMI